LTAQTLARMAGAAPAPLAGPLSGTFALSGFPADPTAQLRLGGRLRIAGTPSDSAPAVDWELDGDLARQRLTMRSSAAPRPEGGAGAIGRSGEGREPKAKPPLVATASVGLVVGEDLRPRLRAPLQVDARLDETPLAELLALVPGGGLPRELTAGSRVSAVLRLGGAPRAPTGELVVSVDGARDSDALGPRGWTLRGLLGLGASETAVDLVLATDGIPRMSLAGSVKAGTRRLVGGHIAGLARAPLDLTLTVPDQPVPMPAPGPATDGAEGLLRALGPLGRLSGSATIRGHVADPALTGRVEFDRLLAACGPPGKASLRVEADRDSGRLELAVLELSGAEAVGTERLRMTLGADWASAFGAGRAGGGTGPSAVARYGPLRWSVHTPASGPIEVACAVPVALTRRTEARRERPLLERSGGPSRRRPRRRALVAGRARRPGRAALRRRQAGPRRQRPGPPRRRARAVRR
jgi:hypothetical protein